MSNENQDITPIDKADGEAIKNMDIRSTEEKKDAYKASVEEKIAEIEASLQPARKGQKKSGYQVMQSATEKFNQRRVLKGFYEPEWDFSYYFYPVRAPVEEVEVTRSVNEGNDIGAAVWTCIRRVRDEDGELMFAEADADWMSTGSNLAVFFRIANVINHCTRQYDDLETVKKD